MRDNRIGQMSEMTQSDAEKYMKFVEEKYRKLIENNSS